MSRKSISEEGKKLKKEYLRVKLQILGYESVESLKGFADPSNGCYSLGKIGSDLESYIDPARIILKFDNEGEERIDEFAQEIEDTVDFIENQNELFYRIRSIYPDFALNMREKVGEEKWELYSRVVRNTGILLKDLTTEKNLARVTRLNREDAISELIDSVDFAKACRIEDEFMIQEFEKFKEVAATYEYEDERVKQTSCAANLAELVRESGLIADKKESYIRSYEKYDEFLNSLKGEIKIKHSHKVEVDDDGTR